MAFINGLRVKYAEPIYLESLIPSEMLSSIKEMCFNLVSKFEWKITLYFKFISLMKKKLSKCLYHKNVRRNENCVS